MVTFLKLVFNILFGIGQALFGALVLSKLWTWFIEPRFPGLPHMTTLNCVGLMIVVGFFSLNNTFASLKASDVSSKGKGADDHDFLSFGIIKSVTMIVVVYPLMLLTAFIWHQFIG